MEQHDDIRCLQVQGLRTPHFVRQATRWWKRAKGLLGCVSLDSVCGLWISPCSSIHTIGMCIPIDVVFLSRDGEILRVVQGVRPFRIAACWKAHSTLELRAGLAVAMGLHPGMVLGLGPCGTWTST